MDRRGFIRGVAGASMVGGVLSLLPAVQVRALGAQTGAIAPRFRGSSASGTPRNRFRREPEG